MKIGLIDVDGGKFPNLALMKISAYHKQRGDIVEWANPFFGNYDRVYKSKIFNFTPDDATPFDCEVVKGGTGYDIKSQLPQGLQDMLSAHHKYTAQANDINNEIIDRRMKTLHLPLKARWFEMIDSGIKTEEYREIKPYWANRIHCQAYGVCTPTKPCLRARTIGVCDMRYTHVKFSYGYTKRTMTFEIESITIGKGKPEWGAPAEDVFIIKLGKRV